jgi:hypothetical protein
MSEDRKNLSREQLIALVEEFENSSTFPSSRLPFSSFEMAISWWLPHRTACFRTTLNASKSMLKHT